jgi:hypothetical protein
MQELGTKKRQRKFNDIREKTKLKGFFRGPVSFHLGDILRLVIHASCPAQRTIITRQNANSSRKEGRAGGKTEEVG